MTEHKTYVASLNPPSWTTLTLARGDQFALLTSRYQKRL